MRYFQQQKPNEGDVDALVDNTAEVGQLADGDNIDDKADEMRDRFILICEHEEQGLEQCEHSQYDKDAAQYL